MSTYGTACRETVRQALTDAIKALAGFAGGATEGLRIRIGITEWCEGGTLHNQLVRLQAAAHRSKRQAPVGYLPSQSPITSACPPTPQSRATVHGLVQVGAPALHSGPGCFGRASDSDIVGTSPCYDTCASVWSHVPPPPPSRMMSALHDGCGCSAAAHDTFAGLPYGKQPAAAPPPPPPVLLLLPVAEGCSIAASAAAQLAAVQAALDIARGLAALHAAGIVHGSLGPSRILCAYAPEPLQTSSAAAALASAQPISSIVEVQGYAAEAGSEAAGKQQVAPTPARAAPLGCEQRALPLQPSQQPRQREADAGLTAGAAAAAAATVAPAVSPFRDLARLAPGHQPETSVSGSSALTASAPAPSRLGRAVSGTQLIREGSGPGGPGGASTGSNSAGRVLLYPAPYTTLALLRKPPWGRLQAAPSRAMRLFRSVTALSHLPPAAGPAAAAAATPGAAALHSTALTAIDTRRTAAAAAPLAPLATAASDATTTSASATLSGAAGYPSTTPTATITATPTGTTLDPLGLGLSASIGLGQTTLTASPLSSACCAFDSKPNSRTVARAGSLTAGPQREGALVAGQPQTHANTRILFQLPAFSPACPEQCPPTVPQHSLVLAGPPSAGAGASAAAEPVAAGPVPPPGPRPSFGAQSALPYCAASQTMVLKLLPPPFTRSGPVVVTTARRNGSGSGGGPNDGSGDRNSGGAGGGCSSGQASGGGGGGGSNGGDGTAAAVARGLDLSYNTMKWRTLAYTAPEVLAGLTASDEGGSGGGSGGGVGPAADVFSFGALLWQLCSGGRPPHFERHPAQILMGLLTGDLNLDLAWPEAADREVAELGRECVRRQPESRPTAAQVVDRLEACLSRMRAAAAAAAAAASAREAGRASLRSGHPGTEL